MFTTRSFQEEGQLKLSANYLKTLGFQDVKRQVCDIFNSRVGRTFVKVDSSVIKTSTVLSVIWTEVTSSPLRQRDLRNVAGKPLIAWTIEAARQSRFTDRLLVYTADSETATAARILGVETVSRPPQTNATITKQQALLELLGRFPGYEYLVVLDSASPLKRFSDIDCCIEICARKDGLPVVSVAEATFDLNAFLLLDGERRISQVFGTGEELCAGPTRLYTLNPSIQAASATYLNSYNSFVTRDTHAYLIPKERSFTVQSKVDLVIAEALLRTDVEHLPRLTAPVAVDFSANNI